MEEALDVTFGGKPPWGALTPDEEHVQVACTDTGDVVGVRLGRFRGTAPSGQVHDADVTVTGDAAVYDRFRSCVDHPID